MMHTYAMQVLLHFQSAEREAFARTEAFLAEVRLLAQQHGIEFDDAQSMRLPSEGYRVRKCDRCGGLTVNTLDVSGDIENVLPDFWFFVRRGVVTEQEALCDVCRIANAAT